MNSYQRLKAKNRQLEDQIQRLYDDPEYYISQVMANNIRKQINEAALFGNPHKPNGKLKFTGLFEKLSKC